MRKLAHETLGVQKHAVNPEDYWEFKPGDPVIADGYPGHVTEVQDGPMGNESYRVSLDNGMGGGEYTAAQLTRPGSMTSEAINLNFHKFQVGDRVIADGLPGYISFVHQDEQAGAQFGTVQTYTVTLENGLGQHLFAAPQLMKTAELESEAAGPVVASYWYPELGSILVDRIPNEQLQVTAGLRRAAGQDDGVVAMTAAGDGKVYRPDGKRWVEGRGVDRYCASCGHYQHSSYPPSQCDCDKRDCACQHSQWLFEDGGTPHRAAAGQRTASHIDDAVDWHQFDGNGAYRWGAQDGMKGETAERDSAQARVDVQRHDQHDIDYLVGHEHGTERGRRLAEGQHTVNQMVEQAPEYNSVEHQVDMLGHELRHEGAQKYPHGHVNGTEITDFEYPNESGIIQCDNCGKYHAAFHDHDSPSQGRIHAVVCPQDQLTDYYTDERLKQRPKYPARGSVKPSPYKFSAATPPDEADVDDSTGEGDTFDSKPQPDVCSFCGNPGPWTDQQDTGRGTRIRCGTCGGTMRLNQDEVAGTSGIQWQPEFPNSPQNAASGAGDPRATTNDLASVHSALNPAASQQAGHVIFHAPELADALLQITAAEVDDEFRFHFTASWFDVRKKATRIRQEDGVRITGSSPDGIIGEVRGDNGVYESAINWVPGTHKVAIWACGCKWGAYAWGRAPQYKRFEGRQCSHVLALQFEAQSRGMFGRDVTVDRDRMEGQHQRTPVTVQYQRPTDRHPGGNINRRTVPPGNVRTEWDPKSRVRVKGSLTPAHEWARTAVAVGIGPSLTLATLCVLGVEHKWARELVRYATSSEDSTLVSVEGSLHHAVEIEGDSVLLDDGRMVHAASVKLAVTADEDGGDVDPAASIPGIYNRDQTDRKKERKHLLHHTNDAREHAHNFGYGLPWGGVYAWCDQCNGSGCGHCGGTGQVAVGTGLPQNPSDASSTESPVAGESADAGPLVGDSGGGMSATGVVSRIHLQAAAIPFPGPTLCGAEPDDDHPNHRIATVVCEKCAALAPTVGEVTERRMIHTADFSAGDLGPTYPAQTNEQKTPASNSPNPGSTGFATSADPSAWVNPIMNSGFDARWASIKMTASGDTSKPPVAAGVALKAADTGRVLMIQRSNKDQKDPARGRWEFPGGHREEGDTTSLHAAIREFEEEVGQPFPEGGHVTHVHRAGPYVLHTVVVPKEDDAVDFTNGRATVNPDDPDGDDHEQSAWWDPEHARKNPALRDEAKSNPWGDIKKAAEKWTMTDQNGGGHGELPERPRYEKPNGLENCRTCGGPEHLVGDLSPTTGQCPMCDNHSNAVGDPLRRDPTGGSTHAWYTEHGMDPDRPITGQHEEFSLKGWHPEERSIMHTLSRFLTIDEARAIGRAEELRTGKTSEQLLREGPSLQHDLDMIFSGTLHDEPEPALPSTDGASETDPSLEVPSNPATGVGPDDWPEVAPGVGMARDTVWGYPEKSGAPVHTSEPGSADATGSPSAAPSGVFQNESSLTPEMQLAAQFNPVLAAFQQTAAFQSMAQAAGAAPDQDAQDVAAAARAHLAKVAAKNFSFAEQQELISEGGGKVRARNFHDLQVEGTHYERLGDEEPVDEWLML